MRKYSNGTWVYIETYVCVNACIYVCMYVYIDTYACVYAGIYLCMYVLVYVCMY